MDLSLIVALVLIVAAIAWTIVQARSLDQRLTSLEKQYLALVADLEAKLYPD